ncbi:hypothetical protein BST81_05300 [Leptolyngbya sp. 'hensonii']|uniref:lecithin retinol acyltransferase family protein n=1 Tax=Leptolyngbya sp. 'hensonii' TaxID=1922337 RepID=UPI00094F6454|nr:lecithin retinol acyltransferase family protein [Leptolyngbya sp. 'hensonii']OLP19485.1 hypothetical protein BST81_05300 [Leptolyngbya sp. 'hensonii']
MARGDQIYTIRDFYNVPGLYEHHGIDCGDGTVIHYQKGKETIARTSMAVFSSNRSLYVKQYDVSYVPDVVIHRAESRLGEQKYNLIFNNCEHFANWCKTGRHESLQVRDYLLGRGHVGGYDLYDMVRQAITTADQEQVPETVRQAWLNIAAARQEIQPRYEQAKNDRDSWQRVARSALQQGREDLARAALRRKYEAGKQVDTLQVQLNQLKDMLETVQRNATVLHYDLPELPP